MTEPFRHLSGCPHGRVVLSGVLTFCWCCSYWRVLFFTVILEKIFSLKTGFLRRKQHHIFSSDSDRWRVGQACLWAAVGGSGGRGDRAPHRAGEGDLSAPHGGSAPPAGGPQQVRTRPSPAPRPRRFHPELPGEVVDSFVAL